MKQEIFQADLAAAQDYLHKLLHSRIDGQAGVWLRQKTSELATNFTEKSLYLNFSAVPRFIRRNALNLAEKELQLAAELRQGFDPSNWTNDQAARVLILLHIPSNDLGLYKKTLQMLFGSADMLESVALYSALPLLPYPKELTSQAREGIRSNMSLVFEAMALHNPYPADYLDENSWNQLFLKAIFTDRAVYQIQGIEKRANAPLARMASDYAHERWAAGRVVSPELWRPVGTFADEQILQDLQKLLKDENPLQHQAVALVCSISAEAKAKAILQSLPVLSADVQAGKISWDTLGKAWEEYKKTLG